MNRGGLAALSDLDSPEWQNTYSVLDREQQEFLTKADAFCSPGYAWPRDPLHTWSRVWEYPYVYSNIGAWRSQRPKAPMPHLVDVGSGTTFFPFSVARLGHHVTCVDVDPIIEKEMSLARAAVDHHPGTLDILLYSGTRLPFPTGEVDAVYCISVLEHIPRYDLTVEEIARILRPGGLFILTFDISLRGDNGLTAEGYARLRRVLDASFEPVFPERTVHPTDLLRSDQGPYPMAGDRAWHLAWQYAKQRLIKPMLGRKPSHVRRVSLLSVIGLILRRK